MLPFLQYKLNEYSIKKRRGGKEVIRIRKGKGVIRNEIHRIQKRHKAF